MGRFTISDIENITGIKAHTIRIWEHRYHMIEPKRTDTNIRYYDDEDLKYFLNIAGMLASGYKISKIARMQRNEIAGIVSSLRTETSNYDIQIRSLTDAMMMLDYTETNNILGTCIKKLGLLSSVNQVFFPFLQKIGIMWQSGAINPAHEHFVTNLVKQKIISAIDGLSDKTNPQHAKRFLLFLPPDETHDVSLLLAHYLLKKAGHHILYLGPNMPFNDLYTTANFYNPHYALTVLTSSKNIETGKMVKNLLDCFPRWPLAIAGSLATNYNLDPHEGLIVLKNISDLNILTGKDAPVVISSMVN